MSELLIQASTNGQIEEVRKLLREGDAVDYANQNGDTALIAAALNGRTEIVELLLDKEADVKNNNNKALIAASARGDLEIVKLLLNHGADPKYGALSSAARYSQTDIVELLLDRGVDINNFDYPVLGSYVPALHLAARYGHTETVNLLLDRRANVRITGDSNDTALINAASEGHAQIVKLLLDHGSDVNHVNRDNGDTALSIAVEWRRTEAVNQIITHTVSAQNNNGADWQLMLQGDGSRSGQIDSKVINLLERQTVILLSVILPEGDLRDSIIENFQKRSHLSFIMPPSEEREIIVIRELKEALVKIFTDQKNISSSSASGIPNEQDGIEVKKYAEAMAIKEISVIMMNPDLEKEDAIRSLIERRLSSSAASEIQSIPKNSPVNVENLKLQERNLTQTAS